MKRTDPFDPEIVSTGLMFVTPPLHRLPWRFLGLRGRAIQRRLRHAGGPIASEEKPRALSSKSDLSVPNIPSFAVVATSLAIAVPAIIGSAVPARADFRLCNNTSSRVSIALAYTEGDGWVSEGWWNVKPSGCEVLVRGPLAAQFYYAYAMDERGGEWKGKAFMCTRDREFKINGRNDCFTRGFDRTGFFEIDTGKDSRNWTVQLTDPVPQASGAPAPARP